ncbi:Os01g0607250, partial [Oryza sativa Japonica Group]
EVGDGAFEPVPGAEEPGGEDEEEEAADGDGGVVEGVLGDRVRHRQREEHGDGGHPQHRRPADGDAAPPQVEGPRHEVLPRQRHPEQDRQRVRHVQPDRRDRHHRLERHQAPQRLHFP